jgi:biotin carboxyl carrier protein
MPLSHSEIARIVDIVESSALEELVIELPDAKLAIRRDLARESPIAAPAPPVPAPPPTSADRVGATAAPARETIEVRAPTLGTFYRAASAGDRPLVEIGDSVVPGQPLGTIEVLRRRATIEAPAAGRVVDIAAHAEALVEYDQILFVLAPV